MNKLTIGNMPPQCCQCNGNGRCKGCICVRNGRACLSCTPGRNGRCENSGRGVSNVMQALHTSLSQQPQRLPMATTAGENENETTGGTSTSTRVMLGGTGEDNSEEDGPLPNNGPQLSECTVELPAFVQVFATGFLWGTLDGVTLAKAVDESYAEAVHWRRNIFMVPSGKTGKNQ